MNQTIRYKEIVNIKNFDSYSCNLKLYEKVIINNEICKIKAIGVRLKETKIYREPYLDLSNNTFIAIGRKNICYNVFYY